MTSLQSATKNHQSHEAVSRVTDPDAWAARINAQYGRAVDAIFATGRELIAAKAALKHGQWQRMFAHYPHAVTDPLQFSVRTAEMLMAIARHPVLSNAKPVSLLPPSWGTLYALTQLPKPVLKRAFDRGAITPETTREEALALRPPPKLPRPAEGEDDDAEANEGERDEQVEVTYHPVTAPVGSDQPGIDGDPFDAGQEVDEQAVDHQAADDQADSVRDASVLRPRLVPLLSALHARVGKIEFVTHGANAATAANFILQTVDELRGLLDQVAELVGAELPLRVDQVGAP
jgi:hypothetical protein